MSISLDRANQLYAWGWRLSVIGAVGTMVGVALLWLGTRVRDRDAEMQMTQLNVEASSSRERAGKLEERAATLEGQSEELRNDTAIANARALEAELKLAEFRRARSIGAVHFDKIVAAIKPFAGTNFDIGHAPNGREQWDFLWQLEPAFPKAGWVFREWIGHGFSKRNWTMTPHYYGEANVLNVSIQVDAQSRDRLLPAAEALVKVLNDIGITAAIESTGSGSGNVDAVHILVGEKR